MDASSLAMVPGRIIKTRIAIESPPEGLWRALADFPAYPDWNPFFRSVRGEPMPGARLSLRIFPPGFPSIRLNGVVLRAAPGEELRWICSWGSPELASLEHRCLLEPQGPRITSLYQRTVLRGLLVPMLWPLLRQPARRGMEAMGEALKQRLETAVWG